MMQRRISVLLVVAVFFIFFSGTFLFGGRATPPSPPPVVHDVTDSVTGGVNHESDTKVVNHESDTGAVNHDSEKKPTTHTDSNLHITITETGGSHDEVIAALVHAFGSQPSALLKLYQLLPRYGITGVMRGFALSNPLPDPKSPGVYRDVDSLQRRPDVFVAGTCELDLVYFQKQLGALLAERKTYLFCVVHHADRWAAESRNLENLITPWVEAGLVEFLTLSPHTATFLQEHSISKWATRTPAKIRSFVPVFPVPLPEEPTGTGTDKEELSFALQGDYDSTRRDYNSVFTSLNSLLTSSNSAPADDEKPDRNVTMHLLGHGKHPDVPLEVREHVKFDEGLDYVEFYSIISRTFALLPAFANNEYLDRKASSSVPAALIGGTPLVATQAIVDAYSYLDPDVVWLQGAEELDLDVVGRILNMGPKERRKKKELVRQKCAAMIQQNTKALGVWIGDAMEKLRNGGKKADVVA
ncbi:hypothetical protein BZA05DRAFT_406684 [Tricharina praecox]|uniref:uncharacterized protein n=1 Tax=Tricharina praecox TaxID=43433 RepID=UPI0022210123|nr:uncharacterized protein BZA05DRAFT_406684 [Tricharina praecox]KAI5846809.1 hypothetical protein BZA05DRAFT_406684 [Tricharina praecox]